MKLKKGFSLLELILVLGIATSVSFMKFQELKHDQENILANAVGQQIKQIGEAVNGYINIHYDKLSTLTSVTSQSGTDPGPRTCSTSTNTCTITYQTLVNEGLLPSSFSGTNANHQSYNIILKRSGISPNFLINGLVTTNNAWLEGSSIRYDLLGKAMQAAGVDSGMSKTNSSIDGYSGSWNDQSSDYSNITTAGLIGYRVGYDSAMYSVFLRRDGTLPMTGDLNMGGQNINNAQNITASGTGNFGGSVAINGLSTTDVPAGWTGLRTHDVISTGTLAVFKNGTSPTAGQFAGYINQNGNIYAADTITAGNNGKFGGKIATNGLDPNDIPTNWGGGVRAFDVIASGTVALIKKWDSSTCG